MKSVRRLASAHILFAVIALGFGIFFVRVIPPFWGIDELTHFNRVYQLSEGQLIERQLGPYAYGGRLPIDVVRLEDYVYGDLQDAPVGKVDSIHKYQVFTAAPLASRTSEVTAPSGLYFPADYVAPLAAIEISRAAGFNIGSTIFLARVFTLALFVAFGSVALWLLRESRSKWIVFTCALVPMSIFQASIINADSFATGLALLLFALIVRHWKNPGSVSRPVFLAILATATLLSLSKPNYLLVAFIAGFLPKVSFRGSLYRLRAVMFAVPVICTGLWGAYTAKFVKAGNIYDLGQAVASQISPIRQTRFIFTHPFQVLLYTVHSSETGRWFWEMIGNLGWNYVYLPIVLVCVVVVVLVLAALYSHHAASGTILSDRHLDWLMLTVGSVTCLSIVYSFYTTYTVVGEHSVQGVQGRYFLPALPFVMYGLGRVAPMRLTMSPRAALAFFSLGIPATLLVTSLVYYSATY
ncbi:MAG: DUF2142 domain-containing protein [Acidimicrobiales bacterium]